MLAQQCCCMCLNGWHTCHWRVRWGDPGGGGSILRKYLWWSVWTLYLLICKVTISAGDSGLCCCVPCYTVKSVKHYYFPLFALRQALYVPFRFRHEIAVTCIWQKHPYSDTSLLKRFVHSSGFTLQKRGETRTDANRPVDDVRTLPWETIHTYPSLRNNPYLPFLEKQSPFVGPWIFLTTLWSPETKTNTHTDNQR